MSKTAYNISLKGYVGGYDFDRATVDKELAKNDKRVSRINLVLDHMGPTRRSNFGRSSPKLFHSQEMMHAQVGSPLAIENAHRNLLDMEDDE